MTKSQTIQIAGIRKAVAALMREDWDRARQYFEPVVAEKIKQRYKAIAKRCRNKA